MDKVCVVPMDMPSDESFLMGFLLGLGSDERHVASTLCRRHSAISLALGALVAERLAAKRAAEAATKEP